VELALHLAQDIAAGATADQVVGAIGGVSLAFEILDSRFVDRKAVSPLTALADAQSNRAFVAGPGRAQWSALDCGAVPLALLADGNVVGEVAGGATSAQVAEALVWLAGHAAARGKALRKGQIIITGSRIGPVPLPPCKSLSAHGEGVGTVSLILQDQTESKDVTA
jgi:2-keto-4-pentenoate hydratase